MSETKSIATALQLLLGGLDTAQVRGLLYEAGFVTPVIYHKSDFLASVESSIKQQGAELSTHQVARDVLGVIEAQVPRVIVTTIEAYKNNTLVKYPRSKKK